MTHDLLHDMLRALDVNVTKIVINDLKNNTFFAVIHILKNGATIVVDSRPSDAIALALRANAPIFVDEKVIEKSTSIASNKPASDLSKYSKDELKEFLEGLAMEDFGKDKM